MLKDGSLLHSSTILPKISPAWFTVIYSAGSFITFYKSTHEACYNSNDDLDPDSLSALSNKLPG